MTTFTRILGLLFIGTLSGVSNASAMTPSELAQLLAASEKITLVDLRGNAQYQQGHIPGAINIPAALCRDKNLPPLGRVVVYDDGLSPRSAAAAAAELNRKPGIQAEVLEGGLSAWEMAQGATTRGEGAQPEHLPIITYAKLKEIQADNVVLVDLRTPQSIDQSSTPSSPRAAALEPLTDLAREFPQVRVVRSPFESALSRLSAAASAPPPLLVLIDCGDGAAESMARTLRANGHTRFAILAGGELILKRQGQSGLRRAGNPASLPGYTVESLPKNSNPK